MRILSLIILSTICMTGWADGSFMIRSAGHFAADEPAASTRMLSSEAVVETTVEGKPRLILGSRSTGAALQSVNLAGHPALVQFEIFDAWAQVSGDLDEDGYFHRLNVVFDADTTANRESVYVKLYLSREGGDWYQYATSDLFEIHYDSVDDTYEVVAELVEGYVPGQYDILIELHSLFHEGIVASRVVEADEDGYTITLEDLQHDEAMRHAVVDDGYVHGTGSFSAYGLVILLLLQWIRVIRWRKRIYGSA